MISRETTAPGRGRTTVPGRHRLRSARAKFQFLPTLQLLVLLIGLLAVSGCQTTTKSLFGPGGTGWEVQQGQALWRPKKGLPEFGGDLVLATNADGRCLIQFDKTPLSMVSVQTTTNRWLIQFPQQHLGFSGHGPGSTRFAWLYLPAALAGKPLPKAFHFEPRPDGGWRLENPKTGESLEGFLTP